MPKSRNANKRKRRLSVSESERPKPRETGSRLNSTDSCASSSRKKKSRSVGEKRLPRQDPPSAIAAEHKSPMNAPCTGVVTKVVYESVLAVARIAAMPVTERASDKAARGEWGGSPPEAWEEV